MDKELMGDFLERPPAYLPYADPSASAPVPVPAAAGDVDAEAVTGTPAPRRRYLLHEATKEERTLFLRKVFLVFFAQALLISGVLTIFLYVPDSRSNFVEISSWVFWPCWALALTVACCIPLMRERMREPPLNLVLLGVVTLTAAGLLGSLAAFTGLEDMLPSVGMIGIVFLCVVLFTFQHKYNLTPIRGLSIVSVLLLVGFGILCLIFPWRAAGYITIPPVVFCLYIITVAEMSVNERDMAISSHEYFYGAVTISMALLKYVGVAVLAVYAACGCACACFVCRR